MRTILAFIIVLQVQVMVIFISGLYVWMPLHLLICAISGAFTPYLICFFLHEPNAQITGTEKDQ